MKVKTHGSFHMMRVAHLLIVAWLAACGFTLGETRTLTDVQGRKIDADILGVSTTHVLLKKGDRRFKVPLERLSQADRDYIASLQKTETVRKPETAPGGSDLSDQLKALLRDHHGKGKPAPSEQPVGDGQEAGPEPDGKAAAVEGKDGLSATPGRVSKPIAITSVPGSKNHYLLYLPPQYRADRQWPLIVIAGPWGGRPEHVQLHRDGADLCGVIVAMPMEADYENKASKAVIEETISDVMHRLPVDPTRVYAGGFHKQGEQLLEIARDDSRLFAGVITSGIGLIFNRIELDKRVILFGLCGSNSFRRYEMALTFEKPKNRDSRLRFFPGTDDWGPRRDVSDGLIWLYACTLKNTSSRDTVGAAERDAFVVRLVEKIKEYTATDVERAYDFLLLLEELKSSVIAKKQAPLLRRDLEKNAQVRLYINGLKDLERFVARYLATDPMDFQKREENRAQKRASEKLSEKYKDSHLGPLFFRIGNPADVPAA